VQIIILQRFSIIIKAPAKSNFGAAIFLNPIISANTQTVPDCVRSIIYVHIIAALLKHELKLIPFILHPLLKEKINYEL
jgi:hypothetical protein